MTTNTTGNVTSLLGHSFRFLRFIYIYYPVNFTTDFILYGI